MPRFKASAVVGCLSLVVAVSAGAQSSVVLSEPYAPGGSAVTAFGYYMSPYSGTVGGTVERLNCVDFFHEVAIGEVWTATSTNLGAAIANNSLLSMTRDGSSGGYASLSDVLKIYMQAAWLTNQYTLNPASDPNRSIAIQTAIWSIVDNGPTNPAWLQYANTGDFWSNGQVSTIVNNGVGSTGYWIAQAQTQYATQAAGYYDQFNILTGTGNPGAGAQEFIYSTPEPATFVLMATGFVGLAGVSLKRRRKSLSPA